ncbi:MAG: AmmeMemoRadiSam system protein A [Deltaproteobacteria bacterium HGW-Deltaproteobacteria-24]|nr:MAG: AmmeMemoRadiSam system protein A [Deltaproteobacteria bacterium HGW-Deltaproteobacteria-24]
MKNQRLDKELIHLAKEAIREFFLKTPLLHKEEWIKQYPFLDQPKATFVTLMLNGQLRGCMGSLVAHRTLYDDLVSNAKAAAFKDPRFNPLSQEEFESIEVELSLLSEPQKLFYDSVENLKAKIHPNIDGVILHYGNHQATFLPQVWEQLPTFELFFEHLCAKAGVSVACLQDNAVIYTYKVDKIK